MEAAVSVPLAHPKVLPEETGLGGIRGSQRETYRCREPPKQQARRGTFPSE